MNFIGKLLILMAWAIHQQHEHITDLENENKGLRQQLFLCQTKLITPELEPIEPLPSEIIDKLIP